MNVLTYSEPGMASVNSYIVDAGEGVIVIDAQRSLSSARKFLATIRQTQKPVLGIFVTHPHPDHIGGLPVLAQAYPQAPLYALGATRDVIQSDSLGYIKLSKQVLGDDFDDGVPVPDRVVASGDDLTIGGLRLHVEDAGVGEAPCMMTLYTPDEDVLFCADVVQHQMTAFLLEGHSSDWLTQLDAVAARYGSVRTVYPGHGAPGPAEALFGYQRRYLLQFRRLVADQGAAQAPLSAEGKRAVVAGMNGTYPGYLPVAEIPDLLEQDVEAVQKEMQAQRESGDA